jgi:hypothetical protein
MCYHSIVTLWKAYTLGTFDSLNLFVFYGFTRFEPLDSSASRNVVKNSSTYYLVSAGRDIQARGSTAGESFIQSAVIKEFFIGGVAEYMDMGVTITVELEAKKIGGKAQEIARANVNVVVGVHIMDRWVRVMRSSYNAYGYGHGQASTTFQEAAAACTFSGVM